MAFLFLSPLALMAQEEEFTDPEPTPEPPTRNFRLGVRTGAAVSTLSSGNLVNPSFIFGLTGGLTGRFKIGHIRDDQPEGYRFGVEPQLNFIYKGSNFKNTAAQYYKMSLFYVDLPVYGIVRLDKKGAVKAMAGPYLGYLMNSSIYLKPDTYRDSTVLKLKNFDFGVAAGIEFKTRPMGFQFIIKQGFTNIDNGLNAVNYPQIQPNFNGGRIRNFSVEIVLSF